jgi:hypothetical protein
VAPKATRKPASRTASLPVAIVSQVDVGRLIRELKSVDETFLQLKLRGDDQAAHVPAITHLLKQLLQVHKLNLLVADDRQHLLTFLMTLKAHAPVIHISFSADPSPSFMEMLMTWLRLEIHPQLLVTLGLQPTIGAGCIVRTVNKQFDFSLRQDFLSKRELLHSQLAATIAAPEAVK